MTPSCFDKYEIQTWGISTKYTSLLYSRLLQFARRTLQCKHFITKNRVFQQQVLNLCSCVTNPSPSFTIFDNNVMKKIENSMKNHCSFSSAVKVNWKIDSIKTRSLAYQYKLILTSISKNKSERSKRKYLFKEHHFYSFNGGWFTLLPRKSTGRESKNSLNEIFTASSVPFCTVKSSLN